MTLSPAQHTSARRIPVCLIHAHAYLHHVGGWNQTSRFALVRAIIEHGTLSTDDTVQFDGRRITGDLAEYKGHFYSDKAPGVALAAVPVVAAVRPSVPGAESRR